MAYKVYKELERILKITGIHLSVGEILDIAKPITTLRIKLPTSNTTMIETMLLTSEQKAIKMLIDEKF